MARCVIRHHHSAFWIILAISQSAFQYAQGYFLEMMTESQAHVVNDGESISLECQFHADQYNLFDYPVLWRKVQRDEETQMNIMSNVNEPFASSNRFEVSFTSLAPRYRFELSIKDVTQMDSGNYTCDVRGPYSSLLGQSTHYLFVRSNVQSVYIFDPDRTQQPSAKSVRLTEAQATRIRCVAVGGYPPPTVELFLGDDRHDVTFQFAYHSSATLSGRRGLRTITYRVERWADAFRVRAEDNGSTLTCVATTPGLPSVSEYAILDVDYTPKLSCSQTSAYLTDKNVHIKCEISARPEATSILWVIDANGTLLAEGQVVNGYWTIIMERADGIVETQLNLGQLRSDSFRQYTLIVENHIGVSKTDAQLSQKYRKSQSPSSSKMGQQSDSVGLFAAAANRSSASNPPPTSHEQPGHVRHVSGRQNHESQMDKHHQQQQQQQQLQHQQQQEQLYDRNPLRQPTNCQPPTTTLPACPSRLLLLLITVPLINASVFVLGRLHRPVLPPFDVLTSSALLFATH